MVETPLHEIGALSPTAGLIASIIKVVAVFSAVMGLVAYMTLAERRISAFIQDRRGPNRVGPFGLLQPIADGIKNIAKEETLPGRAPLIYFVLAPMISIVPALIVFAVIPFAAPLPTPWGLVEMIIAPVPIGILFVLAIASLGVYGIVMAGWASGSKYSLLGGMRAGAQMISYEVSLGMTLLPVFFLAGNVTLTRMIAVQQEMGMWFAFPLGLAFFLFLVSAFAETNRLPFDMPEAEAELVTGYHTEYSAMKFSMFFIAEYAHMVTASALMATLFLGGWSVPFWAGDHMVVVAPGVVMGAEPAWWKTLVTLGAFAAKTLFFLFVYIWVRWTLPRFRYDQVMSLGWKVVLPVIMGYVALMAFTILLLDTLGAEFGFFYGVVLTLVNVLVTAGLFLFLDRDRVIGGASARPAAELRDARIAAATVAEPAEPVGAGAREEGWD